jgi:hypothetical protein
MRTWITGALAAVVLTCAIPMGASADQSARSAAPPSAASAATGKSTPKRKHTTAKRHAACASSAQRLRHQRHQRLLKTLYQQKRHADQQDKRKQHRQRKHAKHLNCAHRQHKLRGYADTASATPSSLVAAYAFDAGSGTTVTDASGNGNNGTISNANWSTAGKYGDALQFNGSSSLVTIPDSASLHLSSGMTLEAWVNPSTVDANWRDVIYKANDNFYLEATSTNGSVPDAGTIAGGSYADAFGTAHLTPNTWAFLTETYDGSTLKLYVNGTLVASTPHSGAISTSTNPLQIGGDSLYGQYFAGLIDNVRIYNGALTAAQIQTDEATPVVPASPSQPVTPPTNPNPNANANVGAPGPAANCNVTLSVGANIQGTLSQAGAGTVVCLNAGNYGSVTLSGIAPSGNVTLAPAPGATVTINDLTLTGAPSSNLTIQGFFIPGGVDDETGTPGGLVFQYNTISHHAHGYGFYFDAGGNGQDGTQTGVQILDNQIDHVGECLAVTRGTDQERAFTFSHNVCGPGIGYADTVSTQPGHYIEIGGVTGVTVDNNAFVGPADPNAAPVGLHLNVFHIFGDASDVDFSNNILWHTQSIGQALLFQDGHFDNVTINNNLDVEDPACATAGGNCTSYSFWTSDAHGLSFQNNTVVDSYWGMLLTESQTSNDYNGGTDYTVAHNLAVQTADGPDISYGECVSSCLFDYNVTDDGSAEQAGSTHNVVNWKPSWSSTSWTPTLPYSPPPAGYYQPTGLPFTAGYTGSIGP